MGKELHEGAAVYAVKKLREIAKKEGLIPTG
jgi:hypothetical protein